MREARETCARRGPQQELDAVAIGDVGGVDPDHEHQTLRVYEQMPLSSLDLLGSVVTALLPTDARGLHRLAIHYARAGLGVPPEAYPHALAQGRVHPFPEPSQAPGAEVVVVGLLAVRKSCGKRRQAQPLLGT